MPGPPDDDDPVSIIEKTRAWLEAKAASPPRERVTRHERRIGERRGLGFTAQRSEDAELNLKHRRILFSYISQLPRERLLEWIDGLWLGNATATQLAALVEAVVQSEHVESHKQGRPRRIGRPQADRRLVPGVHRVYNRDIRDEWLHLADQLAAFGRARRQDHARMNRNRNGTRRSLHFRDECRASAIGKRVEQAGLFAEFFDAMTLKPGEMAAKLLHHEIRQRWTMSETDALAKAETEPSEVSRDVLMAQATNVAALLKQFPTWRTFYKKLREEPQQPNR